MKTIKLNKFIVLLITLVAFTACVQDDDFESPNVAVEEPVINGNFVDIDAVLGAFNQSGDLVTFEGTNNYMVGYVISSDEGGNFFKEVVLQDKPENPTAGIVIQLDVNPIFTHFEFGRKLYIKLDGLTVGENNGVIQLGRKEGNSLNRISASDQNKFIIRSSEVATIVPLELRIQEFSNDKENLFIRLRDVQFNRFDVLGPNPLTFAAEDTDRFDGERTLETCEGSGTVILSTSTFSDFKTLRLPANRGSVDGILTRDFFDDFYTIYINTPADINFTNDERCDPIELNCGLATTIGSQNLFMDNFETQTVNTPISGNGWTNYIEAGTKSWEAYTATGSNASLGISARLGSFGSNDASTVSWLITPAIDLDANNGETLRFKTSNSFSDGSTMEVLFSSNWDGTPSGVTSATWGVLTDAYVTQDSDNFGTWFPSGNVDLSCGSGTIYIAFKYVGSGTAAFDGTYELDDISIDAL